MAIIETRPAPRRTVNSGQGSQKLADGARRYRDLDDALEGISHELLTATLRRAERDGPVVRHLDPGRVDTSPSKKLRLGGNRSAPDRRFRDRRHWSAECAYAAAGALRTQLSPPPVIGARVSAICMDLRVRKVIERGP